MSTKEQSLDFLTRVFGKAPGQAVLLPMPSLRAELFPTVDLGMMADRAEIHCLAGENVYFGTCLLRENFSGPGRGKKQDVRWATMAWADVDVADPVHRAPNLPPEINDAVDLVECIDNLKPSLVISSGYGLHAYWLLDTPLDFGPEGALSSVGKSFGNAVSALQQRIQAEAQARGWHVDGTADVTRVLRLPGTMNYKVTSEPRPVVLAYGDGPVYSYEEFCLKLSIRPAKGVALAAQLQDIRRAAAESRAVEIRDEVRGRLLNLQDPGSKALADKLLAGQSLAEAERDKALQKVASIVAFIVSEPRNTKPEDLLELFRPSLAAWAAEPGAELSLEQEMGKVLDKLTRALEDAAKKKEERDLIARRIEAGLKPTVPTAKYSKEELEVLARRAGCALKDLPTRWIIQFKNSYYILTERGYERGMLNTELPLGLRQELSRADIALEVPVPGAKGGMRPATAQEIVVNHGTLAMSVEASLSLQASYYDAEKRTFHEAVCPLRQLTPEYNAEIEAWLGALGGPEPSKLKDWIATITELERYTSALYLAGPPDSGKTTLAVGLSRLWSTKGPVELEHALANFNERITDCPLFFADEQMPRDPSGGKTSAKLRQIIGSDYRTLNRKHAPQVSLRGNVRVMLAANNKSLITFNEEMTEDDYKAFWDRFMYVNTRRAASYFQARFGGRRPEDWVEGDGIARHALWMRENRQVDRGQRFLASGGDNEVHLTVMVGGSHSSIFEWLANYLAATQPTKNQIKSFGPVHVGNGQIVLNAEAVSKSWDLLMGKSSKNPGVPRIGSVLRQVGQSVIFDRRRVHSISPEFLYAWMEMNSFGDVDAARAAIEAKGEQDV